MYRSFGMTPFAAICLSLLFAASSQAQEDVLPLEMPGWPAMPAPQALDDPELDFMLQQRRMLQDEIQVLEGEVQAASGENARPQQAAMLEHLQATLQRLKNELAELDADIAARPGDSERPDPEAAPWEIGAAPLEDLEDDPRESLENAFVRQLRDRLQSEADLVRERLESLRPDQAPLAGVMKDRLDELTAQIETLNLQLGETPKPAEEIEPVSATVAPNAVSPDEPDWNAMQPTQPMAADSRIPLLQSAAESLRQAGYDALAGQVDQEIQALVAPATPAPSATVTPPMEGPSNNDLQQEVDTMRQEMSNLRQRMEELLDRMPQGD